MLFSNIRYSRLIREIYRNQAVIKIQRWWRSLQVKREFIRSSDDVVIR
jgi:hypothetical protein